MQKMIMTGNEAIARGAYEGGVTVGTAYPGTPSTEILENLSIYPGLNCNWSANEKVALEVAIGASMEGARAIAVMKHVGVNVAADPLLTLSYTGVGGGLVLVSADDPGMHSSQNEQDNRHYARFAKIPLLEPADSQEAKDYVVTALELSERFNTPVMLRTTTRISHSRSVVEPEEAVDYKPAGFQQNIAKYVMLPGFARQRHPLVEERLLELKKEAEHSPLNRIKEGTSNELGVICSGVAYQYVKEALPDASVLKLGFSYPLAENLVIDFARKVKRLLVVEELDPFLENQLKALGLQVTGKSMFTMMGELGTETIRENLLGKKSDTLSCRENIPYRPPILCPGCSHRGVFYTLKKLKLRVTGDIGCYTLGALPPLQAMDSCICMGASIGTALGMEKANKETSSQTVAVIGDSTFFHSGLTPLIDIVYSGASTTVIILDNNTTGMTGHQDHPGTGQTLQGEIIKKVNLEDVCHGIGVERVIVTDPYNLENLQEIIKTEISADEPSVIIARHPCILKSKTQNKYMEIVAEECSGCQACLKLGCPALSMKEDIAKINTDICTGCTLCQQLCKLNAIITKTI